MQDISELSFDAFDELQNPRPETSDFDTVVDSALSRRGFLSSVLTVGAGSFVLGTSALVQPAKAAGTRFGFDAVPASTADTITVPDGYKWNMAVKWSIRAGLLPLCGPARHRN